MYHDNPDIPPACVWCGKLHRGRFQLCDQHEEEAKQARAARGEDIRVARSLSQGNEEVQKK